MDNCSKGLETDGRAFLKCYQRILINFPNCRPVATFCYNMFTCPYIWMQLKHSIIIIAEWSHYNLRTRSIDGLHSIVFLYGQAFFQDDFLMGNFSPGFVSVKKSQDLKILFNLSAAGSLSLKLGTHHAIFVGTTIVVCRDDGRRSSNDPHTPRDDRRMTRTHHATAVGCTHDGRQQMKQIAKLADISSAASDIATSQQEIILIK